MSHKSRSVLHRSFTELTHNEGAVEEMLSYFPTRDEDEPASKEFIGSRISGLEVELEARFAQIDARFAQINARFVKLEGQMEARFAQTDSRFAKLEGQMEVRFAKLEGQMEARFAQVEARFSGLETRMAEAETRLMVFMHEEIRSSMRWTIAMVFSLAVVLVGAMARFA